MNNQTRWFVIPILLAGGLFITACHGVFTHPPAHRHPPEAEHKDGVSHCHQHKHPEGRHNHCHDHGYGEGGHH